MVLIKLRSLLCIQKGHCNYCPTSARVPPPKSPLLAHQVCIVYRNFTFIIVVVVSFAMCVLLECQGPQGLMKIVMYYINCGGKR
jgi:hypothetical protein